MVYRALILAFNFVLLTSAKAELHLAPELTEYELDGVKFKRLTFSGGNSKEINYVPPPGWDYAGSAAKLTMRPPNKTHAQGTVTKIQLPQPTLFDEESPKKLAQEAIASLPPGSTNIAVVSEQKNPVFIGGKETILVALSYTSHGENFGRSLMILNRGKEQLRFQLVSRLEDFTELQSAFLNSHFGWENL